MKIEYRVYSLMLTLAACLALGSGTGLQAQVATAEPAASATKTAEEILARYVEVTGGIEKYKAVKAMRQEGTLSIAAAGIEGTMKISYNGEGQLLVNVEIPGVATESSGINGEIGWSDSTMTGTRLVTGAELEQLKMQANMRQYYEPSAIYEKMEVVSGGGDVDGEKCHILKLTTKSGDVKEEFFSIESGLKLKTKQVVKSPMGEIPMDVTYADYQDVEGLKQPMSMTQNLPNNMQMEIKTEKLELSPKFEPGTFDLPESVKKLVDK